MDNTLILPFIAVFTVTVGLLIVLVIWKKRKQGRPHEINYQAFFTIGIVFLGAGVVFMTLMNQAFIGMLGLGIVYMVIGLANRGKWPSKKKN